MWSGGGSACGREHCLRRPLLHVRTVQQHRIVGWKDMEVIIEKLQIIFRNLGVGGIRISRVE